MMTKFIRFTALVSAVGIPAGLLDYQNGLLAVAVSAKKSKKSKTTKPDYKNKKGESTEEGDVINSSEKNRPEKSKESHKDRKKPAAKKEEKTTKKYRGGYVTLPFSPLGTEYKLPLTGLGMCCRPSAHGDAASAGVVDYIEEGGRHIDTARIYQNHKDIGRALAGYKDIRSELFITTKLPSHDEGYENTLKAVRESLTELQVSYIDLVLLHGPGPSDKKHQQPSCVKYSNRTEDLQAHKDNTEQLDVIKEFERAMRESVDAEKTKEGTAAVEVSSDGSVGMGFGSGSDDDEDDDMGSDASDEDDAQKMRFQDGALFIVRGSKSEEVFLKLLKILNLEASKFAYGPGVSSVYKSATPDDEEDGATLESTAFSYVLEMTSQSGKEKFDKFTGAIGAIKQAEFSDEFVFNCENRLKDYRPCWSETWRALEELKSEGVVRSIGVSNFNVNHLQYFKTMAIEAGFKQTMPAVNQIEFGARGYGDKYEATQEIHQFCKEEGVQIVGYGTLAGFGGKDKVLANKELQALAAVKGKTVSQVLQRWSIQHGVAVIPGTGDPKHMAENIDVFDFELTEPEMRSIENIAGKNYYYYMFGL
jgi:diketogulonate reductase-like aldo/keto reductase